MERQLLQMHKKSLSNLMQEKKIISIYDVDQDFIVKYTYDAVSMEGKNKVPYEQVKTLLNTNVLVGFSEREKKEILNHAACFKKIVKLVESNQDLTEEQIKDLHELLVKDIFI